MRSYHSTQSKRSITPENGRFGAAESLVQDYVGVSVVKTRFESKSVRFTNMLSAGTAFGSDTFSGATPISLHSFLQKGFANALITEQNPASIY